jgi:rod shape-determining protein MreC
VAKGDKIVSSGFSTAFPRGISIGTVEAIFRETRTNDFRIKFKTAADFYNLQYVYVIENMDMEGVNKMLDKTLQTH